VNVAVFWEESTVPVFKVTDCGSRGCCKSVCGKKQSFPSHKKFGGGSVLNFNWVEGFENGANTEATGIDLTFRRLMSYIYGAPILDVSRSHTTTQHSR